MLSRHLPDFLLAVKEIAGILQSQDREFEIIGNQIDRSLDNSFAGFADADGLTRWEKLFSITPRENEPLEKRRAEILSRLNDRLPYTFRTLDSTLELLYGKDGPRHSLEVDYDRYKVTVFLNLALENSFETIKRLLRQRIPANMTIETVWIFKKYKDLEKYTYGKLGGYTFEQIRRGDF
jgi:hypothetical protein